MKFTQYTRYVFFIATAAALLTACKKDAYLYYSDVARIQFDVAADTLKRSTFYYDDASVTEDTVFFNIIAIGGIKNTDRTFTLVQEQLPGEINAEPGKHYVAFNDPRAARNYVIKAGAVQARVPVILLRDPGLKSGTVKLRLAVQPDENFQQGQLTLQWRKVEFTDKLSKPDSWNDFIIKNGFGKYSVAKHEFMIRTTGDKWDNDFVALLQSDEGSRKYYQTTLKAALIEYNKAHPGNPLIDEFGEAVAFL
jgi:hypothetical protein